MKPATDWNNLRRHKFPDGEMIEVTEIAERLNAGIGNFLTQVGTIEFMNALREMNRVPIVSVTSGHLQGTWFEPSLACKFICDNDPAFHLQMIKEVSASVPNLMETFKTVTLPKNN